ncbi:MAG: lysyl oxidase family protein [Actinomycetota bacterium]
MSPFCGSQSTRETPGAQGQVPIIRHPSPRIEPDLVALPSWGIGVDSDSVPGSDYLDFGATVWDRGPSPMVVEGFRRPNEGTMDAWQYFYRGHKAVGRVRAGTLGYDDRPGHQHWHFTQFAAYRLLDASKDRVVRSEKEAFCLAPTDAIDLAVPSANWNPGVIGLSTACGSATSIWTRETLPTGWGDTYFQGLPGQSFDITGLRNGTYYIQVQANPGGIIHERTHRNDSALRKVILGGTPGGERSRSRPGTASIPNTVLSTHSPTGSPAADHLEALSPLGVFLR